MELTGLLLRSLGCVLLAVYTDGKAAAPDAQEPPDFEPQHDANDPATIMENLQVALEDNWAQGMHVDDMLTHTWGSLSQLTTSPDSLQYLSWWFARLTVVVPPPPDLTPAPRSYLSTWQARWADNVTNLARCYLTAQEQHDLSALFQHPSNQGRATARRRGQHRLPGRTHARSQRRRHAAEGYELRAKEVQTGPPEQGPAHRAHRLPPRQHKIQHGRDKGPWMTQGPGPDNGDSISFVASKWLKPERPRHRDPAREAWHRASHRTQELRVLRPGGRPKPTTRETGEEPEHHGEGAKPSRTCRPSSRPPATASTSATAAHPPHETYDVDEEDEEMEEGEPDYSHLPFGPVEATELWRNLLGLEAASGASSSSSSSQAVLTQETVDNIQQAVETMTDEEVAIFLGEWTRIHSRMSEQVYLAIHADMVDRTRRRREPDESGLLQEGKPTSSPRKSQTEATQDEAEEACLMQTSQMTLQQEAASSSSLPSTTPQLPLPIRLQRDIEAMPLPARTRRVQLLSQTLTRSTSRMVTDKPSILALLAVYGGSGIAEPLCPTTASDEWVKTWLRRLTGRKGEEDPENESPAEEIQDSFDQARENEQQAVEEFNQQAQDLELQKDMLAAERYMAEQDAQEAQQRDDAVLQASLGYSYRRPTKKARVRVHMTVGADTQKLEANITQEEPVTITMQTVTIVEPEQWYEAGQPVSWWCVPEEIRGHPAGPAPVASRFQERTLRGARVLNMDDPLVYGYYRQWLEGRQTDENIIERGGHTLLQFFQACRPVADETRPYDGTREPAAESSDGTGVEVPGQPDTAPEHIHEDTTRVTPDRGSTGSIQQVGSTMAAATVPDDSVQYLDEDTAAKFFRADSTEVPGFDDVPFE